MPLFPNTRTFILTGMQKVARVAEDLSRKFSWVENSSAIFCIAGKMVVRALGKVKKSAQGERFAIGWSVFVVFSWIVLQYIWRSAIYLFTFSL
jgi:hypothetical protein